MIMLSRNCPIALIVGVAGFLGSHLSEKLLSKGIQVVGVDNFTSGNKENLEEASKNKNFHFLNQDMSAALNLDLPRLDYAFFIIPDDTPEYIYRSAFENFLRICSQENFNTKIILVSSIALYDLHKEGLSNLKYAEKSLAGFAMEKKANARVVRLSSVFGPRMHFRGEDPIFRLIQSATLDKLQKEDAPLDFTSRSLYIDDAVELLVKAFMHGATAQKIYDGALLHPLKVSEVREILLDPLWYESKGFIPTQLPPWPTPNLLKTEKELAWKPVANIVTSLRLTHHFFKENPNRVASEVIEEKRSFLPVEEMEKKEEEKKPKVEEKTKEVKKEHGFKNKHKKNKFQGYFLGILLLILVSYALIFPIFKVSWASFEIKNNLEGSVLAIEEGDFTKAENQASLAKEGIIKIKGAFEPVSAVVDAGIFGQSIKTGRELILSATETIEAVSFWVEGLKALEESFAVINGNKVGDLGQLLDKANFNLDQADKKLQMISMSDTLIFRLQNNIDFYRKAVKESKKAALVLAQIIPIEGNKSYLVVLLDNNTLRPGGGLIKAVAEINFQDGKLESIKTESIDELEKQFKESINFPADFKQDFSQGNLSLKDSNFESDFPANGKLLQWIYNRAKGKQAAGVITMDFHALSSIVEAEDGVLVGEKQEKISGKNLEKILIDKKDNQFEAEIFKAMLNKTFFLSNQNWTKIGRSLGQSFSEKHMLVFASDPTLFSYFNSSGWTGTIPRQGKEEAGERKEFLAFSETNNGALGTNFYLQREFNLQTNIDQNNRVSHKLNINFINQSPDLEYQGRFKVYLPTGTRLTKTLFGGKNVKEVTPFSDYGRSGYSISISLQGREAKSLSLEYEDSKALNFSEGQVKFSLDVIKQPGMGEDKFDFKLRHPSSYKTISQTGDKNVPQEVSFSTTLAQDRSFEVVFNK